MTATGARRRLRGPLAAVTLGVALAALVLAALEGGARWLAARRGIPAAADEAPWATYSSELGWELRPGFDGEAFGGRRRFVAHGLLPVDAAALDTPRRLAVALGDSRTFGNGVEAEETWVEELDRLLPGIEAVNRGVPGWTSWQGRLALERDLELLRPDVVIFAFGFNDRRYVLPPDRPDGPRTFRRLARRARWTRWTRATGLFRLWSSDGGEAPVTDEPLDLGAVAPRVDLAAYRDNLVAVVELCRRRGVAPVFLLLADDPRQAGDLEAGVRAGAAGREQEAEAALRRAVAAGNVFSDAARLELARLHEAAGRADRARRLRVSPRRLRSLAGGYPLAADLGYRAAALAVAAEHQVAVADAAGVLRARPERFLDFCHFDAAGHRAVAGRVAVTLRAAALAP